MTGLSCRTMRCLCILLLSIASTATAKIASVKGQVLTTPPKIDGKIKPGEWAQADLVNFVPDVEGKKPWPVRGWIGYTKQGLYFAVDCPQETEPKADGFGDAFDLFKRSDTIEFFLYPGLKTKQYLHLAVNPAGIRYDAMGYDNLHDIQWESRTSITKTGWQAEVFLPFAGMGFTDPLEKTWNIQLAVNHKNVKGQQQLTRWPGGKGSFHNRKNYGLLGPLRVAFSRYGDSAKIASPKPLCIGKNPISLQVLNRSGRAKSIRLTTSTKVGRVTKSRAMQLPLPAGKTCSVAPAIEVEALRPVKLKVELLDAAGAVLFCSPSRVLKPAKSKLDIVLLSPAYRSTIFASNPLKQIKLNVLPAFDQAGLKGKTVKVDLVRAGFKNKPMRSATAQAKAVVPFTLDKVGDLPVGDYVLVAHLLDAKGRGVASAEKLLHKLPRASKGTEVIFDEHHRMLVDGKVFFPLAAFMDNLGAPMASCNKAWTVVMPSGYGVKSPTSRWFDIYKKRLDAAHKSGRKIILQLHHMIPVWDDPQVRYACKLAVEKLSGHPALLAWCVDEEANIYATGHIPTYEANYKRIVEDFRLWDPYHPVIGVVSPNAGRGYPDCEVYGPLSDVAGIDIYPIPHPRTGEKISKVAEAMQRMTKAVEGRSPVFFVPQIAGWRKYREPTEKEMRCMFFGSIVTGARGLLAFAIQYPMWTDRNGKKDMYLTKAGVAAANRVASYIALNTDIFNGINHPVSSSDGEVYAVIKETPNSMFLLVANMSYGNKPVELTSAKLKDYKKAVFKDKEIIINNGSVKDTLKPLDCRIYQLEK